MKMTRYTRRSSGERGCIPLSIKYQVASIKEIHLTSNTRAPNAISVSPKIRDTYPERVVVATQAQESS